MTRAAVRVGVLLSSFALLFSHAFAQEAAAPTLTAETKASILKEIEVTVTTKAFVPGVDFSKWSEFVARRQAEIDAANDESAFGRVVNQALRDFGFSHIRLSNPRSTAQRGQTSAVGAGASVVPNEEGLKVNRVVDRGPAKDLGLEVGDIITKIDGKKPTSTEELGGEEGSKKQIEIKKANGDVKTVELEIKKYSTVREETLTWVDEETAMLRVFTFSAGYGRENIEKLMGEAAKAKFLILDLRSNGGGAVNNMNHLLSLLMPNETVIGTFVNRNIASQYAEANPGAPSDAISIANWTDRKSKTRENRTVKPFAGRIAVLTNRGSGSASEITTLALKEQVGAISIGQRTAGAVLASVYGRLPEGWSLQYPVSDYVSAKGTRIEGNPIQPDIEELGRPGEDGVDPVVAAATKTLKANALVKKNG
jgi:carboxyl-terminal processing protease